MTDVELLKAYRDTGLESEEAKALKAYADRKAVMMVTEIDGVPIERVLELTQAEKDGRLLMLPCKVGDTVWTNISVQGDRYRLTDRPYPVKVVFLGMGEKSAYFHVEYDNGRVFPFDFDQFGKTVFLTREEAEAVLKTQSGIELSEKTQSGEKRRADHDDNSRT